jgi:hypothetical protein
MNKEKDLQKIKALATGEQCNIFWFDEGGGIMVFQVDLDIGKMIGVMHQKEWSIL